MVLFFSEAPYPLGPVKINELTGASAADLLVAVARPECCLSQIGQKSDKFGGY